MRVGHTSLSLVVIRTNNNQILEPKMTSNIESLIQTLSEVDATNKTVMNLTRRLSGIEAEIAAVKKEIEKRKSAAA